jgi:hypothetical protein
VAGRQPALDLLGEDGRVSRLRPFLAPLAAALLLTGCTAGGTGDGPGGGSAGESGSPGSSPRAAGRESPTGPIEATPPPAPRAKACYRYAFRDLGRTSNDDDPVPCTGRHDAQTVHVGRLDLVVDGHRLAVDTDRVRAQMARACPRAMARYVGGTRGDRALSRFAVVWFAPTQEQVEQGADWFRCDLVAIAAQDRLQPLPARPRVAGVLDRAAGPTTYGLCGTAEPGTRGFERVICDRRHSWRAIATIPLAGGQRYPGTARVRSAGDESCRDRVAGQADDPLSFAYGWEWPTREQWERGQRYGYCWAPD